MRPLKSLALALEKPVMLVFKRHADYLSRIRVTGTVRDGRSGSPVGGVKVVFVDTGFDVHRRRDPEKHALTMGESDAEGRINAVLDYLWSIDIVWRIVTRHGESFAVRLEHPDYRPETRSYKPAELPIEDNTIETDLGEVDLEPTG